MFQRLIGTVVGLAVAGMVTAAQAAPVRLDYVGNNYTSALAPFTTDMSIDGWVILDEALAPSADNFFADPSSSYGLVNSFSFSDGVHTVTESDASAYGFLFNTDSVGNLIGWRADIQFDVSSTLYTIIACYNPSGPTSGGVCGDRAGLGGTASDGGFTSSPGTWTVQPVPIPAALPLFASALAGMGLIGWRRRRTASA